MRLLLDTHVYVWLLESPNKLPPTVKETIADPANELLFSVCSVWELMIKAKKGRLVMRGGTVDEMYSNLQTFGITLLPVLPQHVRALEALASVHGDPFDRMILAQANAEEAVLVSVDKKLRLYGAPLLWH